MQFLFIHVHILGNTCTCYANIFSGAFKNEIQGDVNSFVQLIHNKVGCFVCCYGLRKILSVLQSFNEFFILVNLLSGSRFEY